MSDLSASIADLCDLLATLESQYWIVSAQQRSYGELDLELRVLSDEDAPRQVWRIHCQHIREHRLTLGAKRTFLLLAEHPLLWKYVQPEMALWFHGRPACLEETLGGLYRVHYEMAGTALPFERFLNAFPLSRLLEGGYGLLARGPESLIRAYQKVLEAQKVPHSFLLYPVPRWSNGLEDERFQALLMEDSFILFKDLEAARDAP